MDLIVCVDDRMGMAFNRRRQSRDRVVCEDIVKLTKGCSVGMDERSAKLFGDMEIDIRRGFGDCEYCFLEYIPPMELSAAPKRIILYRWNRHYPADVYFDIALEEYCLTETVEFMGNSHEKITREVYVYER